MKSLDELEQCVVQWAHSKGIIDNATPITQMNKMQEEVDELLEEVHGGNYSKVADELGDVLVTCVIQASMWGLSLQECLNSAYEKISKRTGAMKGGVFVKDE